MNAIELKYNIFKEVDAIDDIALLEKISKYAKNIVSKAQKLTEPAPDPTLMTKEEYFAMIDESLEQAKRGEIYSFNSNEEMFEWLNNL